MKPRNIDSHSLQQKSGSLSCGFLASQSELVEKLLMAINRPGRARRAKFVCEKSRLAQSPNIIHRPPCGTPYRVNGKQNRPGVDPQFWRPPPGRQVLPRITR